MRNKKYRVSKAQENIKFWIASLVLGTLAVTLLCGFMLMVLNGTSDKMLAKNTIKDFVMMMLAPTTGLSTMVIRYYFNISK